MKFAPFLALTLFIAPLGNAANKTSSSPFLGSTADFKKADWGKNLRIQRPTAKRAVDYDKFIFDPVQIFQSPNSVLPKMNDNELQTLSELFKKMAEDTFKNSVQLVSEPGAGVLRVRFAIRGLKPGRYYMNSKGTHEIKPDTKLAAATFEMDALDSVTGKRVVALIQEIKSEELGKPTRDEIEPTVKSAFGEWMEALKNVFLEKKSGSSIPK